jgi:hypothetical protein
VPHKPENPPQRGEGTGPDLLVIDYELPTEYKTGGSPVTSVQLQWDKGTDAVEWATLIGENPYSTTVQYRISDVVVSGRTYLFRYRSRNIFGWSVWSDVSQILAASVPDSLPTIETSRINLDVKI